ncbi:MAG TPA: hypothetical protein VIK61_16470 [Acidimicrobiia bacterium]
MFSLSRYQKRSFVGFTITTIAVLGCSTANHSAGRLDLSAAKHDPKSVCASLVKADQPVPPSLITPEVSFDELDAKATTALDGYLTTTLRNVRVATELLTGGAAANRSRLNEANEATTDTPLGGADGAERIRVRLQDLVRAQADWNLAMTPPAYKTCVGAVGPMWNDRPPPPEPVVTQSSCNQVSGFPGHLAPVEPTSCHSTHASETYVRASFPAGPRVSYPGDVLLARFTIAECADRLLPSRSNKPLPARMTYLGSWPTKRAWDVGNRSVVCNIYERDGSQIPPV